MRSLRNCKLKTITQGAFHANHVQGIDPQHIFKSGGGGGVRLLTEVSMPRRRAFYKWLSGWRHGLPIVLAIKIAFSIYNTTSKYYFNEGGGGVKFNMADLSQSNHFHSISERKWEIMAPSPYRGARGIIFGILSFCQTKLNLSFNSLQILMTLSY